MKKPLVSAIAAIGKGRVLGKENKLLWHIPEDLKRFREITRGHPVIMGRKTFESILGYTKKPLPERTNIVVTHDPKRILGVYETTNMQTDVVAVGSIEEAIEKGKRVDQEEIFVIGGAQIYGAALPFTDKLYLTLIDAEAEGDSFFPPYEHDFTKIVSEEAHESNGLKYRWVDLER